MSAPEPRRRVRTMPSWSRIFRRRPRRYLSGRPGRVDDWLEAARDYVAKKSDAERVWLHRKPYDPSPGNAAFFTETYQVLNLLEAMRPTPGGRVLEVGSGPGWVSEILMLLGFEVDGVEPSEDMIAIARDRVDLARRHRHVDGEDLVRFHATTLEECGLPDGSMDAVLFHESLHHVIDEERGLAQAFRLLRPGGVMGVSEWAWRPGSHELEAVMEEEMARYGTLENPYTPEYLDDLLRRHGFVDVTRYHGVNGFFPQDQGDRPLREVAQAPAGVTNNLTARKPSPEGPTTADPGETRARIEVLSMHRGGEGRAALRLRLTNTGRTLWLDGERRVGQVRLALRSERLEDRLEAEPRHDLPRAVRPGETIEGEWAFTLTEDHERHRWYVDLVNEGLFWFSSRGTDPAPVEL